MQPKPKGLFFDQKDHDLLNIVNEVLRQGELGGVPGGSFYDQFHPSGISELAESRGLRLAYAAIHLLHRLQEGAVDDRLRALRYLRAAVYSMSVGPMPQNTARVLLQITKELVRAGDDYQRQLELAHDFRMAATGKPMVVRRQLRKYHLLEMPEEWNHAAFDDHVHDASTKGRKTPTHLIMDAWIKGIRRLRVIQYNYVEPRVAAELLEAAKIMGMDVRIGLEYAARFRDKYVYMIWRPRGFVDAQAFLCFLEDPRVAQFLAKGREVARYQQEGVLETLDHYNEKHRRTLSKVFGVDLPPLQRAGFIDFVGASQTSLLHLGRFIHLNLLPVLEARTQELRQEYEGAGDARRVEIRALVKEMNGLDAEALVARYLGPDANPCIANPKVPCDSGKAPELLTLSPQELVQRFDSMHSDHRITLNLSNLQAEDVLEILYDCEGAVTRLEIFNVKDHDHGKTAHLPGINEVQRALNEDNPIRLKVVIEKNIERVRASDYPDKQDRLEKLTGILHDLETFNDMYVGRPIKPRLGSDSTGLSPKVHGMGLVITDTLPARALREIKRDKEGIRLTIPIRVDTWRRTTYVPMGGPGGSILKFLRRFPGLGGLGMIKIRDWLVQQNTARMQEDGNIITLGGLPRDVGNNLSLSPPQEPRAKAFFHPRYLNTRLKNSLKVLIGFIPAFLTFYLTKDWWLLAWFGAVIWFGITGLRNIIQSVLGGGGLSRSPLMKWGDFVSWDRITDSLLFTGFSVPLLDYLAKTVILDKGLGITTSTNPIALYAGMGLVNGLYISSHNILRGLQRSAAVGNLFRSILAIPVALAFNACIGSILGLLGVPGIDAILQKWAAIISKTASDSVAGMIEGAADRAVNMRVRLRDYSSKLRHFMRVYTQLQLLFPENRTEDILRSPAWFAKQPRPEAEDLHKLLIMHSLDMLYFWNYQPRGRTAMKVLLKHLSHEETDILVNSQQVLEQQKIISQMFIDGLVGRNFAKPLAFYLNRAQGYMEALKLMEESVERDRAS